MTTTLSNAQFTIWEDDFEDGDASDWILLDRDGNKSNWLTTGNLQMDPQTGALIGGDIKILGTYNIDLSTGAPFEGLEDNWAISAPIDLSYYSGKIELNITGQPSIYDFGTSNLLVYGSLSPDPASFSLLGTIGMTRETMTDTEFKDYTFDITSLIGGTTVYLAFVNEKDAFIGYEIDKMWITAEDLLGVGDVEKSSGINLKQNPVSDNLTLEIKDQFAAENLQAKIYNVTGTLVKDAPYKTEGISVSDLNQGVYFLVLTNDTFTKKIKFIKK